MVGAAATLGGVTRMTSKLYTCFPKCTLHQMLLPVNDPLFNKTKCNTNCINCYSKQKINFSISFAQNMFSQNFLLCQIAG